MTVEIPEQVTENLLIEKKTPLDKKEVFTEPLDKEKAVTENNEGEVKKPEEKPYPPEGSKRWNDIYKKSKDNERKVKQLEADIELLREHNKQIAESRKLESETIIKLNEKTIKDQIKDIRISMKKAEAEGDFEKAVEYESQIDELKSQIEQKVNYQKPDDKENKPSVSIKDREETEKAVDKFTKETPWFDEGSEEYDEIMADAAIMKDARLLQSWNGSVSDRLLEVKKEIEERFNYKKNGGSNINKLPNVGGGDNPHSSKIGIELTSDQKRVANMLFPDDKNAEKKYLKQLQSIPKRG